MKSIIFFLLCLSFLSACEFNDDQGGFDDDQVAYMLAGSNGASGKQWFRTARFENGSTIDFSCDSSNSMLIKNINNTAALKDSVYFSFKLGESCGAIIDFNRKAVWVLPVVNIQPIDSILFYFESDTLRAAINEITPSKFNISYKVLQLDSTQMEVNDIYVFYGED